MRLTRSAGPATSTRAVTIAAALAIASGTAACSGPSTEDGPARAAATTVAAPATGRDLVAPPTTTFDVGDGSATLACQGHGPVAVILVAGTDDPIAGWDRVVDDLGQEVLACRFAPPSGPDVEPTTPARQADVLSQVLDASGLPGPYVLVGRSLGGLTVRRFGDRHGRDLAGALLIDPTPPGSLASMSAELVAQGWDPDATRADADARAAWPDAPLTVFAHDPAGQPLGQGRDAEAAWTEGQRSYVALTDDARFEELSGAGVDVDLDATRRVTNEIIRLAEQVS